MRKSYNNRRRKNNKKRKRRKSRRKKRGKVMNMMKSISSLTGNMKAAGTEIELR